MEWSRFSGVLLLLLGGLMCECEGCWEHEKIALLQLKPFFPYVDGWNNETENCCDWEMVECNSTSGRVIKLFLNLTTTTTRDDDIYSDFEYDNYYYDEQEYGGRDEWYLDASLFLSFEELKGLYLSGNSIAGCVHNQGFEILGAKLDKLEILDLSSNYFKESILFSLSELSSLKSLYLGDNLFTESNDINGFKQMSKLKNLELLDLRGNMIGNSILSHLHGFTSLKILDLQRCGLKGAIEMLEFSNMMNLTELYLRENEIDSLSFNEGLLHLKNLEVLDLSWNHFNKSILPFLGRLTNLNYLSLGGQEWKGTIDLRELRDLNKLKELYITCDSACSLSPQSLDLFPSLKTLSLYGFNLNGTTFQKLLNNFTNLEELWLDDSSLTTNFLQAIGQFTSLKRLSMGYCEINNGSLTAQGLLHLKNLEVLDLSRTPFNKSILPFLSTLTNLNYLSLGGQEWKGTIDLRELRDLNKLKELRIHCYFYYFQNTSSACSLSLSSLDLFPSLKTLSLDGFNFKGTTTFQKLLHNFTNLEELWLEESSLPTNFLQVIGQFTSLKRLTLGYCEINNGSLTAQELLHNLTNLEELRLSDSSLLTNFLQAIGQFTSLKHLYLRNCEINNGSLTAQGLLHLKNLESLHISYTSVENSILDSIGAMPSLNFISLTDCGLNGSLPVPGICELRHLRRLDIRYNYLMGNLPDCLSNLTSLEYLDLSSNHLSGNISSFQSLTSLEYLDLSSNQLSGNMSSLQSLTSLRNLKLSDNYFHIPSSFGPLFNLSKLKSFEANNNTIYAETEMPHLAPSFQLNKIGLSCCGEVGSFPRFLYYQHDLYYVDLSNINLTGEFPNWLLENNTGLQTLLLANNCLMGNFELPFLSHAELSDLDVSQNSFSGKIPIEIGEKLPSLRHLNMSKNSFSGGIPASIGDMKLLQQLDLGNNKLTGGIPEPLATGCSELRVLMLSSNNLQGQMFSPNFSLIHLTELHLDGNHFSGRIPDCLSKCSSLITLDVSNNQLSARIPGWMGDMSSLETIIMPNNHLKGKIPVEFCQLDNLVLLDLSANSINGNLPSCFSPSQIKQVYLSKNRLQGVLTNALRNSSNLIALDISHNQLSGRIPHWIGGLSNLNFLLLNNNFFEGSIPIEFCNLSHLSLINLSHNNLSGHIPPCLKLNTLKDVSKVCANPFIIDCGNPLSLYYNINSSIPFSVNESIEFTTKNASRFYKGRILPYMSGIDLSCNNLVGEIPYEIRNFHKILVLNLSHNSLTGQIPPTFSNLTQIESLDLSHNNLSGNIPPQLVGLYRLEYFNVSCNNLSGKTPQRTAQFATFDESSYRGNPFLCGEPLPKCPDNGPSSSPMPTKNGEDKGPIDMDAFCVTFGVAYVMVLLSIGVVLYINPYWRRVWFYRVETIATSCYYFVIDNILPQKFHCGM